MEIRAFGWDHYVFWRNHQRYLHFPIHTLVLLPEILPVCTTVLCVVNNSLSSGSKFKTPFFRDVSDHPDQSISLWYHLHSTLYSLIVWITPEISNFTLFSNYLYCKRMIYPCLLSYDLQFFSMGRVYFPTPFKLVLAMGPYLANEQTQWNAPFLVISS